MSLPFGNNFAELGANCLRLYCDNSTTYLLCVRGLGFLEPFVSVCLKERQICELFVKFSLLY